MRALGRWEHPCHERFPSLGEALEGHPPPDELVQDVLGPEHGEERLGEVFGVEGGVGFTQEVGDVRAVGRLRPDVKAPVRWRRSVGGAQQVAVRLDVREQGPAEGYETGAGRGVRSERGRAPDEGFLEGALRGLEQREGERRPVTETTEEGSLADTGLHSDRVHRRARDAIAREKEFGRREDACPIAGGVGALAFGGGPGNWKDGEACQWVLGSHHG
jgi:hypothetical protein